MCCPGPFRYDAAMPKRGVWWIDRDLWGPGGLVVPVGARLELHLTDDGRAVCIESLDGPVTPEDVTEVLRWVLIRPDPAQYGAGPDGSGPDGSGPDGSGRGRS
jgi:hypothetical protein